LLDAVGVQRMLDKGRAMGLVSLKSDASVYGLSLTLGGGEVRLIDLATAYHTIADGGEYVPYSLVLSATDGRGNPLGLFPPPEPVRVLTPAAAFQVTSMLSDARARMPAFGANSLLTIDRPAAAKTGTTTSYRDNWTVGFTRYLVTGVWAGNSDGRPMRGVTGVTGAGPIWHEFMQAVIDDPAMLRTLGAPDDATGWEFLPPETVEERPVLCTLGMTCPSETEYFSRKWIASRDQIGVQSDGLIVQDRVLGVLANDQFVGGCSSRDGAATRTLLRLPSGMGLLSAATNTADGDNLLAISPNIPIPAARETINPLAVPVDVPDSVDEERAEAIKWTLTTGAFVHLGPCNGVDPLVRSVFSGTQSVSFDVLPEIGPIITSTTDLTGTGGLTGTGTLTGTAVPDGGQPPAFADPAAAGSQFQLIAAGPGDGCAGNQIQGVVADASGAPIPGVRVIADDQYGNRAETVSKGGGEAGRFDFGLAGSNNTYYVTLLDAAGMAISATGVINHSQPGEGSACYWVQFQASPG
jgi:hypothetical protein